MASFGTSVRFSAVAICAVQAASAASGADLRVGMRADPDILDPAQGASVAGRMIFAAMCDKLIDTTPEGGYRPQLATDWTWSPDNLSLTMTLRPGVRFHDGEELDADAAKFNLERYRSDPLSRRRTELAPVESVEVVDPMTVRINLTQPYAPLLGVLADRAGMMMSPAAVEAAGENIGLDPACAGPFELVERVAQDHIRLDRFEEYWNKDEIFLDSVTFVMIPDDAVRLLSLRSGDLDIIERLAPSDMATVEGDPNLRTVQGPSLAYDLISINVDHGDRADNPLGSSEKVRQAFDLAIDREAINQVVYGGLFVPSNQHEIPGSPYFDPSHPVKRRDVEAAKALLAEAGEPNPSFTLSVANSPVNQQVAQMIQAMAGEAGFAIELQAMESASLAADADEGDYQAALAIWSGRPDPDANVSPWAACDGFLNWGGYCNPDLDEILAAARKTTNEAERQAFYQRAADIYLADLPHIILYHYASLWAHRDSIEGFVAYPDSLLRLQGVRKTEAG